MKSADHFCNNAAQDRMTQTNVITAAGQR